MFYTPLVAILSVVIAIYVVLLIFNVLSRKTSNIILLSILGLSVLVTAGYEIKQAYINSIATVDDREVNLVQYEPFAENTKAVNLDKPSSYHIDNNLPKLMAQPHYTHCIQLSCNLLILRPVIIHMIFKQVK